MDIDPKTFGMYIIFSAHISCPQTDHTYVCTHTHKIRFSLIYGVQVPFGKEDRLWGQMDTGFNFQLHPLTTFMTINKLFINLSFLSCKTEIIKPMSYNC